MLAGPHNLRRAECSRPRSHQNAKHHLPADGSLQTTIFWSPLAALPRKKLVVSIATHLQLASARTLPRVLWFDLAIVTGTRVLTRHAVAGDMAAGSMCAIYCNDACNFQDDGSLMQVLRSPYWQPAIP